MSRRRPRVGAVVQVALPDGRYAYGRVLEDAAIGFYRARTAEPGTPPIGSRDYEFVVGITDEALREWPVVGQDPGRDPDDDWPPPRYVENPPGSYRIYERGALRPASREQVRGLEPQGVYAARHVIDRLTTGRRMPTVAEHVRAHLRRRAQQAGESRAAEGGNG